MGVRRRWLTWAVMAGLAAVFVGHRIFHDLGAVRFPLSLLGTAAVLGATLWRGHTWWRARGPERRVEGIFALTYLGCAVALAGLMLGTEDGVGWMGLDFADPLTELRFRRGSLVAWSIVLVASAATALAAQWASRFGGGDDAGRGRIEMLRVSDLATAALNVVLAGSFLMIGGYLAAAHDRIYDASYFKTSTPGTAVQEIVGGMASPLRVLLFFPDVDPVKDEVANYFSELSAATGNVAIEEYDRFAQPAAAAEHEVSTDGTVILVQGERRQRFGVPTDLGAARSRLRVMDGVVQGALLRLTRDQLVAYMTVGHGELNDPFRTAASAERGGDPPLGALRGLLELLSYEVRELGLQTGLADRIPDDAASLLVIGPERPFLSEEMAVVEDYLDRGGSLLLALEPGSDFTLDRLRERLGVDYASESLADDRRHVRQRGGLSDRRLIITDRTTAHAAVTTASRQGVGSGILLPGAGHLVEVEGFTGPRRSFVMESMPSTFADLDGDLQFDEGTESRGGYHLAAAIEGPTEQGDGTPMRALVYADAEMFSDAVLLSLGMNAAIVADGVRWLAQEEQFSGQTMSEADVPIVHTNAEDVAWFYAIILGAPALVLLLGMTSVLSPRLGGMRREA